MDPIHCASSATLVDVRILCPSCAPNGKCCITRSLFIVHMWKESALRESLVCDAGLAGAKGLTPEELLGSDKNKDVLVGAGLWKQSYWYRLKQRMQPPHMEGKEGGFHRL